MPAHLSVATAIEKAKIASPIAFILLLDIRVVDANLNFVEMVRLAKNDEDVVYQGNTYAAANFTVDLSIDAQTDPRFSVQAQDPTGVLASRMELYGGGVGFDVTLTVVNTGNLTQAPEIQETFTVNQASKNGYVVSFTMGIENPIAMRFPYRLQWQNQCPYAYKGPRCQYVGSMTTCDFTYNGSNGCVAHANAAHFGGFLGLANLN